MKYYVSKKELHLYSKLGYGCIAEEEVKTLSELEKISKNLNINIYKIKNVLVEITATRSDIYFSFGVRFLKERHSEVFKQYNDFVAYCTEFYGIDNGIYPTATNEAIREAVKKYFSETPIGYIDCDSVDRENVLNILKGKQV